MAPILPAAKIDPLRGVTKEGAQANGNLWSLDDLAESLKTRRNHNKDGRITRRTMSSGTIAATANKYAALDMETDEEHEINVEATKDCVAGANESCQKPKRKKPSQEPREAEVDELKWQNAQLTAMVSDLKTKMEGMAKEIKEMKSGSRKTTTDNPTVPRMSTRTTASSQAVNNQTQATTTTQVHKKKIPAIVTSISNSMAVATMLKDKNIVAHIVPGKRTARVIPNTSENHEAIWSQMKERNIQGHTNDPAAPGFPKRWILRGLDARVTPQQIEEDIEEAAGLTVVVRPMTRRDPNGEPRDRIPAGIFEVTAASSEQAKIMRDITTVFYHRVSWEAPHKADILQCFRCQGFGHTSRYCNYTQRCVKCDKQHEEGECTNTKTGDNEAFCVNCGTSGHPANWKGCSARKAKIEQIMRTRDQKQKIDQPSVTASNYQQRSVQPMSRRIENVTYSQIAADSRPTNTTRTSDKVGDLLGMSLLEVNAKIQQEVQQYKNTGGQVNCKSERDTLIITILARIQIDSIFNV